MYHWDRYEKIENKNIIYYLFKKGYDAIWIDLIKKKFFLTQAVGFCQFEKGDPK